MVAIKETNAVSDITSDTTPPKIISFNISPKEFNTTSQDQTLTLTIRMADDLSGVYISSDDGSYFNYSPQLAIFPVDGVQYYRVFHQFTRISGDDKDGVYTATVVMPKGSTQGEWSMGAADSFSFRDKAGNWGSFSRSDLENNFGVGVSEVTNLASFSDTTPPEIKSFNITPHVFNTNLQEQILTVIVEASDDFSGVCVGLECGYDDYPVAVGSTQLTVTSVDGYQSVNSSAFNRVSGDSKNGVYTATVVMPKGSAQGEWSADTFFVVDTLGNYKSLSQADLISAFGAEAVSLTNGTDEESQYDFNDNVIHIDDSEQGGECFLVGAWNSNEKKCQLSGDVYGKSFFIDSDGIILDGNSKKIEGATDIKGVIVDGKKNVKINNIVLKGFSSTIYIKDSTGISIENNQIFGISNSSEGVNLLRSNNNIIRSNSIFGQLHTAIVIGGNNNSASENNINYINTTGIRVAGSDNNIFSNSISYVHNFGAGISAETNYSNNHFYGNTISNCGYGFIMSAVPGSVSLGNEVYHNNFIDNWAGAAGCGGRYGTAGCQDDLFYKDLPEGGNYWSENNCVDADANGICDSEYNLVFSARPAGGYEMRDKYPWSTKDGWKNQPPILSEVTPVPISIENQTPSYTFNSTQAGAIAYGGDCSSSTTVAVTGDNTIIFNSLSEGLHNNCAVMVTNDAGKNSNILTISPFTVVIPSKDFTFVHMTDVHLGENLTALAKVWGEEWFEEWSYSRFINALYQIEKRNPKPEFILISGDLVEYAGDKGMSDEKHPEGWKWLTDFKSFVDGYEERTGIKIFYIPGNHDRYERPAGEVPPLGEVPLSAGNDKLFQYGDVIQSIPDYATSLFDKFVYETNYDYDGGYDPFNYYFSNKDKSINFIGLDTGADNGGIGINDDFNDFDDLPKSTGITNQHIEKLEKLSAGNKIIFMHSPIFNEGIDGDVPNGSISGSRDEFIDYCKNNNVDLVLSGHTHKNRIYNKVGNGVINATSLTFDDEYKPYYIQTQSATKGNNRGFRIIDVSNGESEKTNVIGLKTDDNIITPQLVFEEKQGSNSLIELSQENNNNKISAKGIVTGDDFKFPYYYAEGSKKLFLENYDDDKVEISIKNSLDSSFEIAKFWKDPQSNEEENYTPIGRKIFNPEFCESLSETRCQGGIVSKEIYLDSKASFRIRGLETHEASENKVKINWEDKKIDFIINNNNDTALIPFNHTSRARMNSPAELRVVDSNGRITGLKDGKIIEEIPNSYYDPVHEQVIFFTDSDEDFQNLQYEAAGIVEGEYKLTLESGHEDVFDQKVEIIEMPITESTVHQFSVDWNQLNDKKGVEMKIDQNGDGNFEKEFDVGSVIAKDDVAPATEIKISSQQGQNNWHKSDVEVSLEAQDNEGGIGVEKTEYSLDGGENWIEYKNPFAISEEGIHQIQYRSIDWFGNQEETKTAEIKIDKTAPEAVVSPSLEEVGIEVGGTDNLTETTIDQKSATEYVISDEAGNTAKLQLEGEKIKKGKNHNRNERIKKWRENNGFWKKFFNKFRFGKETNPEVSARLKTVQYNEEPAIQLSNNRLHFVWKTSKKELATLLEQQLEVFGKFRINANYNDRKDETKISIHEKGKPKNEIFDGLKVLNMETKNGVLQYSY